MKYYRMNSYNIIWCLAAVYAVIFEIFVVILYSKIKTNNKPESYMHNAYNINTNQWFFKIAVKHIAKINKKTVGFNFTYFLSIYGLSVHHLIFIRKTFSVLLEKETKVGIIYYLIAARCLYHSYVKIFLKFL